MRGHYLLLIPFFLLPSFCPTFSPLLVSFLRDIPDIFILPVSVATPRFDLRVIWYWNELDTCWPLSAFLCPHSPWAPLLLPASGVHSFVHHSDREQSCFCLCVFVYVREREQTRPALRKMKACLVLFVLSLLFNAHFERGSRALLYLWLPP